MSILCVLPVLFVRLTTYVVGRHVIVAAKSFCAVHKGGVQSRKKPLDNFDRAMCGEAYPTTNQSLLMAKNGERKSLIKRAASRSRREML
jgi:hypothetical protein